MYVAALEDGRVIASCGFLKQDDVTRECVAWRRRRSIKDDSFLLQKVMEDSVSSGYGRIILYTTSVQKEPARLYEG
jgi:hypothetical protein